MKLALRFFALLVVVAGGAAAAIAPNTAQIVPNRQTASAMPMPPCPASICGSSNKIR
jgi:hypothetical protein